MATYNITLDERHRIGIARLAPGETLLVTAPPALAEIAAKHDRPWVTVSFDGFGVRPAFNASPEFVAARYAGTGPLYRAINSASAYIEAGAAPAASIVFEPRGKAQAPTWIATGYELGGAGADSEIAVGATSPTEPAPLGAWLRKLPLNTILASARGDAWQRWEGTETVYKQPDRVFPALNSAMVFGTYELTDGHAALEDLAAQAPFTILALGAPPAPEAAAP